MLIEVFKKLINTEPSAKTRFIFIGDNEEIMQNVTAIGYSALYLTKDKTRKNVFTLESFKEYLSAILNTGTMLQSYYFVPACFEKRINDELQAYFKRNYIEFKLSGWTLFRGKEFLGNYDRQQELEDALDAYIERFTGSRTYVNLEQFHLMDDNGKVTGVCDIAIVDYLMDTESMFVIDRILFLYQDGVFREDQNGNEVKAKIQSCLYRNEIKSTALNRIYDLLVIQTRIQRKFDEINKYPRWWINFQNGMLDVKEMVLHEHSPDYYSVNQIPHDFKLNMTADGGSETLRFLETSIPDKEDKAMLYTYIGYCMTIDASMQRFLMIKGEAGTGKSRVINLVQSIVGRENYSNISLHKLNERFYPTNLFGKLMNSCADISSAPLNSVDVIKMITGEDEIMFERKGQDADRTFKSYAKLLFSANQIPLNLDEKSNAFYRRLLILEMNVVPEVKDRELDAKLEKEIEYSVWLAVRYLRAMYKIGEIPESSNSKRLVNELYKDADSVKAWIDDCCECAAGYKSTKAELNDSYKAYCEQNDRTAHGRSAFYKNLSAKGFKEERDAKGRYVKGIRIKFEDVPDADIPFQ